jgi:hypothetical protein
MDCVIVVVLVIEGVIEGDAEPDEEKLTSCVADSVCEEDGVVELEGVTDGDEERVQLAVGATRHSA